MNRAYLNDSEEDGDSAEQCNVTVTPRYEFITAALHTHTHTQPSVYMSIITEHIIARQQCLNMHSAILL